MESIAGRAAFITGGSRGIGAAVSRSLAGAGTPIGRGRMPGMPALAGMMRPEDVAEAVLFVVTRPRTHRVLEVAFRPVTEPSWG